VTDLTPDQSERVRSYVDWTFLSAAFFFSGYAVTFQSTQAFLLAAASGVSIIVFEAAIWVGTHSGR